MRLSNWEGVKRREDEGPRLLTEKAQVSDGTSLFFR